MKETTTSGGQKKFKYEGSLQKGFTLYFDKSHVEVPSSVFFAVLEKFSKQSEVVGGFERNSPPEEGIGYFVWQYSKNNLPKTIFPLNGTHIVAILIEENLVTVKKVGVKVFVDFLI
jgi:hypothetical protein